MVATTRNEFLDLAESDNEYQSGHDSEEELTKGRWTAKRRRLTRNADSDDEDDEDDEDIINIEGRSDDGDAGLGHHGGNVQAQRGENHDANEEETSISGSPNDDDDDAIDKAVTSGLKPTKPKLKLHVDKPLLHKNLITTDEAIKKSGVIYLSRIPPFMKPSKMRSLLAPHGSINRIFLSPEDPVAHARRVRAGGNKKRSFTEGWVEFVRKKDAKRAAELLNTRPIGGRKGSYYRDDIWSIIYLGGFKWRDLTGQIAAEDAERASRMRAELERAAKSDREFVQNIEHSKQLTGIVKKRKEREFKEVEAEANAVGQSLGEARRSFRQVPLAKKRRTEDQDPSAEVAKVLSKIF